MFHGRFLLLLLIIARMSMVLLRCSIGDVWVLSMSCICRNRGTKTCLVICRNRGIGTETCRAINLFPSDDLMFSALVLNLAYEIYT